MDNREEDRWLDWILIAALVLFLLGLLAMGQI